LPTRKIKRKTQEVGFTIIWNLNKVFQASLSHFRQLLKKAAYAANAALDLIKKRIDLSSLFSFSVFFMFLLASVSSYGKTTTTKDIWKQPTCA